MQQTLFSGSDRLKPSAETLHPCHMCLLSRWVARFFEMSPFEPWTTRDKVERVSLGIANLSPDSAVELEKSVQFG